MFATFKAFLVFSMKNTSDEGLAGIALTHTHTTDPVNLGIGTAVNTNGLLNTTTAKMMSNMTSQVSLGFGVPYFNTFFLKGTLMK